MEHINEIFKDINWDSEAIKDCSFSNCRFLNCRFDKTDLKGLDFTECYFDHCEVILPNVTNTGFRGVSFKDSKLVGVDFAKCNVSFLNLAFENSLIDTCNFSSLKMKKTSFIGCIMREVRFVGSLLNEACFNESDLERTLFHQCDLEKASFVNAKNYFIDPMTNKIKGAIFSLPEAVSLLRNLGIELV